MKQKLVAMVLFTVMTIALPLPALSKTPLKEQATHDPLFAIVYLSSKVKFEPAPEAIFICEDLRKPRRKLSLFGKTTRSGTDFYYVFGRVEVDNGAGPTGEFETQNDDGIIVALSPEGCRDIGAGYALSSDPKQRKMAAELGITDEVVTALLSDMIDREVAAFGGVSNFLKKVKAAGVPDSYQPPQVRARLDALRKQTEAGKKLKSD